MCVRRLQHRGSVETLITKGLLHGTISVMQFYPIHANFVQIDIINNIRLQKLPAVWHKKNGSTA